MKSMELADHIASDPGILGGKPCVKGTRMRVRDVLELLGAGSTIDEIVEDYPYVKRDDVLACLRYAAEQVDHPVFGIAAE